MPDPDREFSVHAVHIDRHHARRVVERSFEAAAVAYVEDFPHPAGEEGQISVIVRETASGREHCFRVDVGRHDAKPCE